MNIEALDGLRIILDPAGQLAIAAALALIMFGVALGLKVSDFAFLKQQPVLFFGGVATQIIGLPLLTLAVIMIVNPPASVALGMIVVACCPGGSSSNLLTFLARGNTAYSVALTAASSLIAAAATPASILLWSNLYPPTSALLATIAFSPIAFLIQTSLLLAVPLAAGMLIAHNAPEFAKKNRQRFALVGAALLGGVIVYGSIRFLPILWAALPLLIPLVFVHNGLAFALGRLMGRLLGGDEATRRALTFEVGIQNSGLALVILLSQLEGLGGATAIAAVWGVWHLIAGGVIVSLFRRQDAKQMKATYEL